MVQSPLLRVQPLSAADGLPSRPCCGWRMHQQVWHIYRARSDIALEQPEHRLAMIDWKVAMVAK